MKAYTKASIIRFGIPVLRLLPFYAAALSFAALYDFGPKTFIVYAPPLQKMFYVPLMLFVWSALALVPFVLLRKSIVFYVYIALFFGCLSFMAYDYLVPFRYVSPTYEGEIMEQGQGGAGNREHIDYWVSHPTWPPHEDDWPQVPLRVAPLILAFVYRRYFHLWSTNTRAMTAAIGTEATEGRI